MLNFTYTVTFGGGAGPDVWDSQRIVSAVDIQDALNQCADITESGHWIFSVDQNDYATDQEKTIDRLQRELDAASAELRTRSK